MDGKTFRKGIGIVRVVHVEQGPNGKTEHELTGEELEEWKKAHGYSTDTEDKSDTE